MLLGLSRALSERTVEQIVEKLQISGLEHNALRQRYVRRERLKLKERGQIVSAVLRMLQLDNTLWARLLAAGELAGLWSSPKLWVPTLGRCVSPQSRVLRGIALGLWEEQARRSYGEVRG